MRTLRKPSGPIKASLAGLAFCCLLFLCAGPGTGLAQTQDFSHLPVKGMVTLIDLGADQCVPCKMMAPILAKLEKEYKDRAVIVVIDVYKHRDQVGRFGIRAIPTQIFYDPSGKEVARHVGFMSEKAIVDQLSRMGVK
ncbi:MAG: thioredoxin family protein [Desulfobacterales bacterium]|jgi:thioredoxin 1|nr:thioredoxin family protein [Desulfobacterales bacterium]